VAMRRAFISQPVVEGTAEKPAAVSLKLTPAFLTPSPLSRATELQSEQINSADMGNSGQDRA
jgi:hypothetical protein